MHLVRYTNKVTMKLTTMLITNLNPIDICHCFWIYPCFTTVLFTVNVLWIIWIMEMIVMDNNGNANGFSWPGGNMNIITILVHIFLEHFLLMNILSDWLNIYLIYLSMWGSTKLYGTKNLLMVFLVNRQFTQTLSSYRPGKREKKIPNFVRQVGFLIYCRCKCVKKHSLNKAESVQAGDWCR